MGIDRIGKGGGVPPAPEGDGKSAVAPKGATSGAEKTFEVKRPDAANAAQGTHAAHGAQATQGAHGVGPTDPASPLARLRRGEIDVHGYVDLKVDEATKALHGLSPEELADVKSMLRDQLRTDPALAELVQTATGKAPSPPED